MAALKNLGMVGCGGIAYYALVGIRAIVSDHWGLWKGRISPDTRGIALVDPDAYQPENRPRQGLGALPGQNKAEYFSDVFKEGIPRGSCSIFPVVSALEADDRTLVGRFAIGEETLVVCCPDNDETRRVAWDQLREFNRAIILVAGCDELRGQVTLGVWNTDAPKARHNPFCMTPLVITDRGEGAACGGQNLMANVHTANLVLEALSWALQNWDGLLRPGSKPGEPFSIPAWFWTKEEGPWGAYRSWTMWAPRSMDVLAPEPETTLQKEAS